MRRHLGQIIAVVVLGGVVVLLAVGVAHRHELRRYRHRPVAVMGTECTLLAVAPLDQAERVSNAFTAAEEALRTAEVHMSVHLSSSEISRLNAADANEPVTLSADTRTVLAAARQAYADTDGAFDATCQPLIELWKAAAEADQPPTDEQLAAARDASTWEHITLTDDGAVKAVASVRLNLGGLAKGYAIDQAVEAMQAKELPGGLVEVGGDIRCFGRRADGRPWRVAVRNCFDPAGEPLATLRLTDRAVCTSGNYYRYSEIQGRRYSHIIDPRPGKTMGHPAEAAPSVTVVAPDAITADVWATALSVLGADGLALLPDDAGVEAMIVEGTPQDHRFRMTDGFAQFLAGAAKADAAAAKGQE